MATSLSPRFSPGLQCLQLSTLCCLPRAEKGRRTRRGSRTKTRRQRTGRTRLGKQRKSRCRRCGRAARCPGPGPLRWPGALWARSLPGPIHSPRLCPQEQKASKKKELPKELRQDPPILRVLGSGLVALEPLLVGEPLVSEVCNFGVIRTLETDNLIALRVGGGGPATPLPTETVLGPEGLCRPLSLLWKAPCGQAPGRHGGRGREEEGEEEGGGLHPGLQLCPAPSSLQAALLGVRSPASGQVRSPPSWAWGGESAAPPPQHPPTPISLSRSFSQDAKKNKNKKAKKGKS